MRFRSTIGCTESDFAITHSVTTAEIPIHSHSEYAVSYFFRGPCRCALESRHYMEFHAGDVGLLNPGEAHEDFASTDVRDYVTVRIKKHFIRSLLNDSGYSPAAMPAFPTMKLSAGPDLSRICDQMRAELQVDQFGRDAVLEGLVAEMAILLFRRFRPAEGEDSGRALTREDLRPEIRRAVEFLHDNYTRRFSLDMLASAAGTQQVSSRSYLQASNGSSPAHLHGQLAY